MSNLSNCIHQRSSGPTECYVTVLLPFPLTWFIMQRSLRLRIRLPFQRNPHECIRPPSAPAFGDHFFVHSHVAGKLCLRPLRMYVNMFMDEMKTHVILHTLSIISMT